MSFVVRKPAGDPRAGAHVYLMGRWFRDGADKLLRHWSYQIYDATRFRTRYWADKAAERWDGDVIDLAAIIAEDAAGE